ncbi:single-stranded DNA-binding protein WHY2, mitochondrial-like [Hibiscus syriacus]|uniref:single-stranded DNA-binding protein WHY2, mitochondrial-like n=1 Tax=Hibiscus syriacus TaxID=106335 RepID=UPI00192373ED|nr:single-stranded DNA-binding protein WHY2, mitochondrial-like [Hibiscus syriacus]
MLNRWRSLLYRNHSSKTLLSGKWGDSRGALCPQGFEPRAAFSTSIHGFAATGNSSANARVFAPYTIYKGKAALSVSPLLPTFSKIDSANGGLRVDRRGSMMLTFLPAIGERKYDWEKRQKFALSPTEVGSLISMGAHDASEFYHDPAMKSSNAGQVSKKLFIKALDGGNGYMVSLTVTNNILKSIERINVPVTTAEFAVLKTACSFALPHIIGWDRLTNQSHKFIEGSPPKVNPKQHLDLEWDR